MKLSIIIALFIALTLFAKSNWSSFVFRFTSSAFDTQLWDGLIAQHQYLADDNEEDSTLVNNNNFFEFKPMTTSEINRRRFIVMEQIQATTIQHFLFSQVYKVLFPSLVGKKRFASSSNSKASINHPFQVLWKKEVPKEEVDLSLVSSTTFPIRIEIKIYDRMKSFQLAPLSEYRRVSSSSSNEEGDGNIHTTTTSKKTNDKYFKTFKTYKTFDEKNPLELIFETKEALSQENLKQIQLFPGFKKMIAMMMMTMKVGEGDDDDTTMMKVRFSELSVVVPSAFGTRGFPLWNILPNEDVVVDMRIV